MPAGMAHHRPCPRVARYLITQCWISAAVGLIFAVAMLCGDIAGIRSLVAATSPKDAFIFLAGSVMTFFPFVLATAIGLLPQAHD